MAKKIKLYGEVYQWGQVSHRNLVEALKDAGPEVHIHVHSPGGEVFEGYAIFNLLQSLAREGTKIIFYVDGIAASMASFIIQAGHEIWAAENSMLMLHAPSGGAFGGWRRLKDGAELLQKIEGLMVKEYARRSGQTEKKAQEWMIGDNWMTPEEALKAGLIDGIVPAVATRKMEKDLTPAQAYEAFMTCLPLAQVDTLLIPESAMETKTQTPAAVEDLTAMKATITQLVEEKKSLATELAKANEELVKVKQEAATAAATALVDGAVQAGRIAPGDKDKFVKLAAADYDTTKAIIDTLTPVKSVVDQISANSSKSDLAKQWDEAYHAGTLESIKEEKPELFKAMKEAKFPK